MSKAIICDKCGRIFPTDGEYHLICIDRKITLFEADCADFHLCEECTSKLRQWIEEEE